MIAQAVLWGIPTPAFSTALAFFDGYRSEIVPANILQAQVSTYLILLKYVIHLLMQRDYFGAHTFKVLPGTENERLKAGEDIRKLTLTIIILRFTKEFFRHQLDRSWRQRLVVLVQCLKHSLELGRTVACIFRFRAHCLIAELYYLACIVYASSK